MWYAELSDLHSSDMSEVSTPAVVNFLLSGSGIVNNQLAKRVFSSVISPNIIALAWLRPENFSFSVIVT